MKLKTRDFGVLSANKKIVVNEVFPNLMHLLPPPPLPGIILLYEPFGLDLLAKLGVIYLSTYRIVHWSKREWTGTSSRKRKKKLTSNLLRNFYLEDNLKVIFFFFKL